jgi:two-component system chemotaxis sensor kinase CheA
MQPIAGDPELVQAFLIESGELLQGVDQDLIRLESAPEDQELLNRTFRALHSIKGTASFLGFEPIVRVSHGAEEVLTGLRQGRLQLTRTVMDTLLEACDRLVTMLRDLSAVGLKEYDLAPLLAKLEHALALEPASPRSQPDAPGRAIQEPTRTGETKARSGGPPMNSNQPATGLQSMRVDVHKLDELIGLIGELVLERNRLLRLTKGIAAGQPQAHGPDSPLTSCALRLSFITEELQAAGLRTRMVPIETVLAKFPRMVRDLAHSLGKEVELVVRGQETEIDKTMVELVSDPLVHVVRNALDHGLETPEARERMGKPRKGRICVEAAQEGDRVLLRISDDGSGIDRARVVKKAIQRQLITDEQALRMSVREIHDLLFLPGFSTVENATDISGRGVGMDVVRTNLKKINGAIEIESQPGSGTTICLRLPLTLAILPVLLVRVSDQVYALPLRCIEQTARFLPSDAHQVEEQETILMAGEVLPLLRLHHLFAASSTPVEAQKIVVLEAAEKRIALLVDGLMGQESTVVTPLSPYLSHCTGIAGSTVDGEGRVRLVLDPAGLLTALRRETAVA